MATETIITESDLPAEVLAAIKQGRKIVAIKLLCESTGIGMANAKVLVDRASARIAPRPPRQALMKDYSPTNRRLVGMFLLLLGAFAAYRYFLVG